MLKLMSQPSTTFMTSAIEYILMPLISTVMNAKVTAERPGWLHRSAASDSREPSASC